MKLTATLLMFFIGFCALAQDPNSNYKSKKMPVSDTIVIDTVSINSSFFTIKTKDSAFVDTSFYEVDFAQAILTLRKPFPTDSIIINYFSLFLCVQ